MLGIPGSEGGAAGGGEFLGRLQYDSRVGFWKVVRRVQDTDGRWVSQEGDLFPPPLSFLMDIGSLEVGYIKLDKSPAFVLVPFGTQVPPQPQELKTDENGKSRKAFQPGFRIKVQSPKTFGDADAYYFSANARTVLGPMDELYTLCLNAPEAAQGLVPVIQVTGKLGVKAGESTFYAPVWQIVSWQPRPAVFGERVVPPPTGSGTAPAPAQAAPAPAPAPSAPPANHVPPPAAVAAAAMAPQAAAAMPDSW